MSRQSVTKGASKAGVILNKSKVGSLKLCKLCLARQGFSRSFKFGQASPEDCELCRGTLSSLNAIAREAGNRLNEYEFETFLVGTSVPQSIVDREDEIRAKYKIRGKEGLKTQVTRSIGKSVSKICGKKVDYARPDITVLASLVDGTIAINSRSIWLRARYIKKKRGLSQKSTSCEICKGLGCAACDYKGNSGESIQAVATLFFRDLFRAEDCSFIWTGSEDEKSLVNGRGRLFFVEVLGPKKRTLASKEKLHRKSKKLTNTRIQTSEFNSDSLDIRSIEVLPSKPNAIPQFKVQCRAFLVREESQPGMQPSIRAQEIESRFRDALVQVRLSRKFKTVSKRVYSIRVKEDTEKGRVVLDIECDGGIPIKKFLRGMDDTVVPNLSAFITGYEIDRDQPFDVLDLNELSDVRSLTYAKHSRPGKTSGQYKRRRGAVVSEFAQSEQPHVEDKMVV